MRTTISLCVSVALAAGVTAASDDPEQKVPEYASKSPGARIAALIQSKGT
jgi:hypothetical protein